MYSVEKDHNKKIKKWTNVTRTTDESFLHGQGVTNIGWKRLSSALLPLNSTEDVVRSIWKVSNRFQYLKNELCDFDVTCQPIRGDLTVHAWTLSHEVTHSTVKHNVLSNTCELCYCCMLSKYALSVSWNLGLWKLWIIK